MCAQRTGAHRARHPAGFSFAPSPRHRGPIWAASCRRSNRSCLSLLRQVCRRANDCFEAVQGCTDSCINRRRSRRRASQASRDQPEGARRWIAALAKQYMDVLSEQPGAGEKRRGIPIRTMRIGTPRPVPSLLVTFGHPKSNSLARRASESIAFLDQDGFRLSPE